MPDAVDFDDTAARAGFLGSGSSVGLLTPGGIVAPTAAGAAAGRSTGIVGAAGGGAGGDATAAGGAALGGGAGDGGGGCATADGGGTAGVAGTAGAVAALGVIVATVADGSGPRVMTTTAIAPAATTATPIAAGPTQRFLMPRVR